MGGDLISGDPTIEYVATVGDFVYSMAWDGKWISTASTIEALEREAGNLTIRRQKIGLRPVKLSS